MPSKSGTSAALSQTWSASGGSAPVKQASLSKGFRQLRQWLTAAVTAAFDSVSHNYTIYMVLRRDYERKDAKKSQGRRVLTQEVIEGGTNNLPETPGGSPVLCNPERI